MKTPDHECNLCPFVSVIVPVFNDAERLALCLESLERQTYPKDRYQVVVVDNGSIESVEPVVARFRQAQAVHESRPGSYAARNTGISLSNGEVVAFTDADCIPARDWIEKGVAALLLTSQCGLVAGNIDIVLKDPEHPTAVELYEARTALRQSEYVEVGGFGATANLFTFREVFERAGLFDAEVKSGGDIEWGQRVTSHGYRLIYADEARVAHPARRSLRQLYRRVARVIGGVHDLSRKKSVPYIDLGKGFFVDSLPPIRASIRVFRDPAIHGLTDRVRIIAVMFFVQYAQVWEMVRLKLGVRSKR
jgi:glycosyltransferase involved in cell wall biosynthesis